MSNKEPTFCWLVIYCLGVMALTAFVLHETGSNYSLWLLLLMFRWIWSTDDKEKKIT